jgi:hypothetical protein
LFLIYFFKNIICCAVSWRLLTVTKNDMDQRSSWPVRRGKWFHRFSFVLFENSLTIWYDSFVWMAARPPSSWWTSQRELAERHDDVKASSRVVYAEVFSKSQRKLTTIHRFI